MLLTCVQLRQLEMQLEQEFEEKQMVLHEKQDLEGLIATLCEQVGNWNPSVNLFYQLLGDGL